jgi:hypothetical protein
MSRRSKKQRAECPTSWMDVKSLNCVVSLPCTSLVTNPFVTTATASITADKGHTAVDASASIQPLQQTRKGKKNRNQKDRLEADDTIQPSTHSTPSFTTTHIRTPLASKTTLEIVLDRFDKEIIRQFGFALNQRMFLQRNHSSDGSENDLINRTVLRQRIRIGINACTRILEANIRNNKDAINPNACLDETKRGIIPLLMVLCNDLHPALMASHIPVLCQQCHPPIPLLLLPGATVSQTFGSLLGVRRVAAMLILSRPLVTESNNHPHENGNAPPLPELNPSLSPIETSSNDLVTATINTGATTRAPPIEEGCSKEENILSINRVHDALDSWVQFVFHKMPAIAPYKTTSSSVSPPPPPML